MSLYNEWIKPNQNDFAHRKSWNLVFQNLVQVTWSQISCSRIDCCHYLSLEIVRLLHSAAFQWCPRPLTVLYAAKTGRSFEAWPLCFQLSDVVVLWNCEAVDRCLHAFSIASLFVILGWVGKRGASGSFNNTFHVYPRSINRKECSIWLLRSVKAVPASIYQVSHIQTHRGVLQLVSTVVL